MSAELFVDPQQLGNDANSGTSPLRPRATLPLTIAAGITVYLRRGSVFGPQVIHANGITVKPYALNGDSANNPLITSRRPSSIGLLVDGQDNTFEDLSISGCETHVQTTPDATGCTFTRLHLDDYAYGFKLFASHTTLHDPVIRDGRMARDTTDASYVGASAITLWKDQRVALTGTRIYGAHIERAWAARLGNGQRNDGDGSCLEVFGGVTDTLVQDLSAIHCKVLCEIGATAARKETISGLIFRRCVTEGSGGKVLFVNNPSGVFSVDWRGVLFEQCTFVADGYNESPFYMAGATEDYSTRLSVHDSVIVAAAQVYNSGTPPALPTIERRNNLYWRSDGRNTIGIPLATGEVFADPQFYNAAAHDYRLTTRDSLGALGRVERLPTGKPGGLGGTVSAAAVVGGAHTVETFRDMLQISVRLRVSGMTCYVTALDTTYRLQKDKNTWLSL